MTNRLKSSNYVSRAKGPQIGLFSAASTRPQSLAQSIAKARSIRIFEALKSGLQSRGITSAAGRINHIRDTLATA
jgi:hypothetical protein